MAESQLEFMDKVRRKRLRLAQAQADLDGAQMRLDSLSAQLVLLVSQCSHEWGEPQYIPERIEGYHIPAVELGSDSTGALDVPPKTIPKWFRRCKVCQHEEFTKETVSRVVQEPAWR